jgi:glutathione reductase (NADPH)
MIQTIKKFDYLVIGAGSGGIASGRRAAMFGKSVCILENRKIGGTCVNVGCVPKKVMFNLANWMEEAHLMKDYGVLGTKDLKLDYKFFKEQRDAYVTKLNIVYKKMLDGSKVEYVEGTARFESDNIVECEGQRYSADHILIASGSTPELGGFLGSELCMNSNDFFEMSELPKSIICIGGGYIGVELAQIMAAFGVKVTLVTRGDILKHLDRDIVEKLMESMRKLGVEIMLNRPHKAVTQHENGSLILHLHAKEGELNQLASDKILLAMGRPPNVLALGLENTGIKVQNNFLAVDEF